MLVNNGYQLQCVLGFLGNHHMVTSTVSFKLQVEGFGWCLVTFDPNHSSRSGTMDLVDDRASQEATPLNGG